MRIGWTFSVLKQSVSSLICIILFIDSIRPVCLPFRALNLRENTLYRLYSNNSKVTQSTGFNAKKYSILANENCRSPIPLTDATFCAQAQGGEQTGVDGDPFMQAIKEGGNYPIYQVALGVDQTTKHSIGLSIHPYIGWIKDTINGNIEKTRNEVIRPYLRPKEFVPLFQLRTL